MKKLTLVVLLASFLGGLLSLAGYKFFIDERTYQSIEKSQQVRFSKYASDSTVVVPQGMNFIYAADAVRPAVVHIKTLYEVQPTASRRQYQKSPFDDMLKDYFGDGYSFPDDRGGPDAGPQEASGSGVILTQDGYIVTNNHVIDKADKIEVVLNDKRSYQANLIGIDPTTDLALLKIDETGLPFVQYGNSDQVRVGEWVLAVGNPFNLTSTVTAGIVSAKGRNINILRDKDNMAIESFIQTDAAVNPGNSGGALVNLKGELIGINTAIATPTGSFAGYSFAVPVQLVKKVMDDLLKYGQVQRALLGVTILDINAKMAKEKGFKEYSGVYVAGVNPGSAADKAGLKEGDVITQINGIVVNSASELQENVARFRPGDKIKVNYLRGGKAYEAQAVLKNKMGDTGIVKKDDVAVKQILGAEIKTISKEEAQKMEIGGGAKVMKVGEGKLKEAGIREGFIITSVDKNPVKDAADIEQILDGNRTGGLLIEGVYPNGQKAYYAIGW
ncbi:MAG: Do family serine endopeptidase [Cytophagaceae bacterium]